MVYIKQNNIDTIFLDADGVLVDLDHVLETMEGRSLKEVHQEIGQDNDPYIHLMRKHLEKRPFEVARPHKDFEQFMTWSKLWISRGIDVQILSSGSRHADLYAPVVEQKLAWLAKHKVAFKANFAQGARKKVEFAKPGRVLIDDYVNNVEAFNSMGAIGIHHTSISTTETELTKLELI